MVRASAQLPWASLLAMVQKRGVAQPLRWRSPQKIMLFLHRLDRHPTLCRILSWRASDGDAAAAAAAVAEQQAAQASAEKDTDLSEYLPSWEICR